MIADIEMPRAVERLPRDHRGYPVPWFVAWIGKPKRPEFRVVGPGKLEQAVQQSRCWICGGLLVGVRAYVVGPMCAVNRVSSEPPSHRACATYAAKACPFLAKPHMRRREPGLPEDAVDPAGTMLRHNPGVALVWMTGRLVHTRHAPGGLLFDIGVPEYVEWYREGRPATHNEALDAMTIGFPALQEAAEAQGPDAEAALAHATELAIRLLPTTTEISA